MALWDFPGKPGWVLEASRRAAAASVGCVICTQWGCRRAPAANSKWRGPGGGVFECVSSDLCSKHSLPPTGLMEMHFVNPV